MFYYILSHHFNGGFYRAGERERECAIAHQALIHSMNQFSCILLLTVIVLPEGMMANKSEVELHMRVCGCIRDKT